MQLGFNLAALNAGCEHDLLDQATHGLGSFACVVGTGEGVFEALDLGAVDLSNVGVDARQRRWRFGDAGFDLVYAGNFVDLGLFETQEECNACTWIFPGDFAERSMERLMEKAGPVDAVVVNGMPNFRRTDGLPRRMLHRTIEMEALTGVPVVASDTALYWRMMKTLGVRPTGQYGRLLDTL